MVCCPHVGDDPSIARIQATPVRVIGVTATDAHDRPAGFSSVQASLDLSPPGDGILSAFALDKPPSNSLGSPCALWSGASMAMPWVAGAADLLLERNPNWTPDQIANQLQTIAVPINGARPSTWAAAASRLPLPSTVTKAAARGKATPRTKKKAKMGHKGK